MLFVRLFSNLFLSVCYVLDVEAISFFSVWLFFFPFFNCSCSGPSYWDPRFRKPVTSCPVLLSLYISAGYGVVGDYKFLAGTVCGQFAEHSP